MKVRIDPQLCAEHPGVAVRYVLVDGVTVERSPPRLRELLRRVEEQIRAGDISEPLLPGVRHNLDAWAAFSRETGAEVPPSPAWLVELVGTGRPVPRTSNVVDVANLAALCSGLPVAAFDRDEIAGGAVVRQAREGESYVALFERRPTPLRPGEIVYADDEGVFSRHAKDSHRTRVRESTTRVLFVVDGCPGVVEGDLDRACALLTDTLRDVVPGCEPTSPRPATVAE
jgi:DNA/RNA-binding domain of Phe-tRNA-synthetase-like protein